MKKYVAISLFIFFVFSVSVITAGLLNYEKNKQNTPPTIIQNLSSVKSGTILNLAEISRHNNQSDCWLLVSGKVYDVTGAISSHPGGATEITRFCGKDGTTAFQTKGGEGKNHSSDAYSMLSSYYIGDIGTKISGQVQNMSTGAKLQSNDIIKSKEVDDD